MASDHQLSLSKACELVGLSRSAFYKPKADCAAKGAPVVDVLNAIVAVRARWNFWKCFRRMRKDGRPLSHRRVYRVYRDMRLNMKWRTKKAGHHARASAAGRFHAIEPSMGAGLYARHAIRLPSVSNTQYD